MSRQSSAAHLSGLMATKLLRIYTDRLCPPGDTAPGEVADAVATIAAAAQQARQRLDTITEQHTDAEYECIEALSEPDEQLLETLVGAMLTVMQEAINALHAAVKKIDRHFERQHGRGLSSLRGDNGATPKTKVYRIGPTCDPAATTVYVANLINALANYFKHAEEMNSSFDQPRRRQPDKLELSPAGKVLNAAGITKKKPWLLTETAALLAPTNDWVSWAREVTGKLHEWAEHVLGVVESDL